MEKSLVWHFKNGVLKLNLDRSKLQYLLCNLPLLIIKILKQLVNYLVTINKTKI